MFKASGLLQNSRLGLRHFYSRILYESHNYRHIPALVISCLNAQACVYKVPLFPAIFLIHASLQCRDGKKIVMPHVLSLSANVDRGVLAFLFNSLQHIQKVDSKQRLHQRTVRQYASDSSLFAFTF